MIAVEMSISNSYHFHSNWLLDLRQFSAWLELQILVALAITTLDLTSDRLVSQSWPRPLTGNYQSNENDFNTRACNWWYWLQFFDDQWELFHWNEYLEITSVFCWYCHYLSSPLINFTNCKADHWMYIGFKKKSFWKGENGLMTCSQHLTMQG